MVDDATDRERDLVLAARGFLARSTRAAMAASFFSVASSSSPRLRARSSASSGLRQTIRRSPG